MKNFINKVKICLNNENGGPNVEAIIGLGVSFTVIGALAIFADQVYDWIYSASEAVYLYQDK